MKPEVRGVGLDAESRCAHYHSVLDVVAIKMRCCGEYFACKACHDELADHPPQVWPSEEWHQRAVLCGACSSELTITRYLESEDACPECGALFNPACRLHQRYYFEP